MENKDIINETTRIHMGIETYRCTPRKPALEETTRIHMGIETFAACIAPATRQETTRIHMGIETISRAPYAFAILKQLAYIWVLKHIL